MRIGLGLFTAFRRGSDPVLARFMSVLAICAWACTAYAQNPESPDAEQNDPQPCMPSDAFVSRPGDPPFGAYVQTTALYKNKRYLLGVQYCEDGTFEFTGHEQGTVSLEGAFFGTGQWWWEGKKSCTEIDQVAPSTELPSRECKQAGHWFGDHEVPVPSAAPSARQKPSRPASPSDRAHARPR